MSKEVVIASGVRTAIGTFGGSLAGLAPCELAARVAGEAIARSKVPANDIGQTVFGNVIHTAPEDMYLSRVAAIRAGVPETSPALDLESVVRIGVASGRHGGGSDPSWKCRDRPCRWCGKHEPGGPSFEAGAVRTEDG